VEADGMTLDRKTSATRRAARLLVFLAISGPAPARAVQESAAGTAQEPASNVPPEARALVVKVVGSFGENRIPGFGSGIIIGGDGHSLYIATAAHVVRKEIDAHRIVVTFASGDTAQATLLSHRRAGLDLAVLSVVTDSVRIRRWAPRSWDRLADVETVRRDDPTYPVGCPPGRCWRAPARADRVVGVDGLGILFQSSFVDPGSSGGALFNAWWEVVGMITEDVPPEAYAVRIDEVVAQARTWDVPGLLKRPVVPRAWYRTTIGAVLLASTSSSTGLANESRFPSGRATATRQISPVVSWHLGALRLAPENLAVTAGMAGVGVDVKRGRLVLHPFVEAGIGHVEGRFDAGGYYVATANGTRYVPRWLRAVDDALGVGGGATLDVIARAPIIIETTVGYWRFSTPDRVPKLRSLFIGAGLRVGL
jgi:S1-C subfamily serine protease